ncbi:MAG: substrate-binding domain-containing protein [Asticcacaulis sp.]|uniref:LacI family DNA-binding transcriptional regulator n=1 Tax=Asticcacaulis sp. TaxID=1872648 RepID=UPI0039E593D0
MPDTFSDKQVAASPRLKMSDIAALAGVSVSTVSRALAGNSLIPQRLRERIEELAENHGYAVNHAARNLRLQKTQTIGIVVPVPAEMSQSLTDPLLLQMIGHLTEEISQRGYDLLLRKINAPQKGWLQSLIQSHRFDGLLVLGHGGQQAALQETASKYLPMVVWGERATQSAYCTVGIDNVQAGRTATEHLISIGRKAIRFLGPAAKTPEVESRYRGYVEAISLSGLSMNTAPVTCQLTHVSAYEAVRALLQAGEPFDALFCASDIVANAARMALTEARLRIPDAVALVGFDDVPMAQTLSPPLTTIRQDPGVAANLLVEMLFRRMAGQSTPANLFPARLIVRQSSVGTALFS